ncbi:MAG: hypothetical protein C7B45_16715 [Sulfobacillus acidophilus]|uniref:DUF5666 domain-containing protein n=1 Tax=Sulfobacillus acidophilus TaxID=53633 RepID=A0A2T2WCV3_9FIRM|nr:MAG: hypothetical protein C7B45_16715 [Sulfobacillus acidophilus]
MKKLTMISLLAGIATTGVLAAGPLSFAASAPLTAGTMATSIPVPTLTSHTGTHKQHLKALHHATVTTVSSTTLTLTVHNKKVQTLPVNSITVHVGAYPGTTTMLAAGQHVVVLGAKSAHPQIIILPVAQGVLTASNGGWTIVNSHTIVTLGNVSPTMLGMSSLTSGTHVSVYGTRSGTTVTDSIIAAAPTREAGTVVSNLNGVLTVKTQTNPSLTITESTVPGTKMLAKVKAGHHVLVVINPATKTTLAVIPRPAKHHKKIAYRANVARGTFVSESTQSLDVANRLGTESVSLAGRTVKLIWPQHTGATLSQIPVGTPLSIRLAGKANLIVHVSHKG